MTVTARAAIPATADVIVVGAGPAGATAATLLARAGRSVVVVDKAVFPRDKCCGDGLTTLALRELELLGLQPAMVPELEVGGRRVAPIAVWSRGVRAVAFRRNLRGDHADGASSMPRSSTLRAQRGRRCCRATVSAPCTS